MQKAYFATWGPFEGPIRWADAGQALGVVFDPSKPPMPDGTAFPVGYLPDPCGSIATWRLVIGKQELPGRWTCVGRRFIPIPDDQGDDEPPNVLGAF